jgi:hypothetical protein
LTVRGERRQRRPEHAVAEDHPSIDDDERRLSRNGRRGEDREIDSPRADRLPVDPWRARLRSTKGYETLVRAQSILK